MKKTLIIGSFIIIGSCWEAIAQDTREQQQDQDTSYWDLGFKGILTLSQSSFSNWISGGENTVSFNTLIDVTANYNKNRISWSNAIRIAYGFTNQKSQGNRKTDDKLAFESNFGYRFVNSNQNWLWTTSYSFLTQFVDGFNYPNDSVKISAFLAPGYMFVDTGLEFKKEDKLSLTYSPLAAKWTIVSDDSLSNTGAFGVTPGENVRPEFGTSLRIKYKNEIIKNVLYDGNLMLFSDYKTDFGNFDVFFNNLFVLKINDWLASTLTINFIYDDNIIIPEYDDAGDIISEKPRLQFKQVFGLGLTLRLD